MGKPELILRRGSRTLDLNDQNRYWLAQNFVPPALQISTQLASGSSANLYGGSTVTSWKASDRSLSFTVRLDGSSGYDIQSSIRALNYMLNADVSDESLYLEYRSDGTVPQPLWGQTGTPARYEVVHGDCALEDGYLIGVRRNEDVNVTITLLVNPFMLGKQQRICAATGGIIEDTIGSSNGISKGVIIPAAATNKFTNPVFGHATFSDDWTAGSDITATANTDPEYVLFGSTSAKLTCNGANINFTQTLTLTVATYTLSFYAKRPNGEAVTASQITGVLASGVVALTFTSGGNGWYRCAYSGTASDAAALYGMQVLSGYTVYVDGFQVETGAYATPLAYGDLLGCAWAGTAHESASTRTASSCTLPVAADTYSNAQGSARFVVRFDVPNTYASNMTLFDTRDGGHTACLTAYYNASVDAIYFYTTANTAVSSALTFSAGATYIVHFVWGAAAMKIYVNGLEDGTDNYVYAACGANVFIGCDYSSTSNVMGAISSAAFFDEPLTAAQVLADYNNLAPVVARGEKIDSVPYLWTIGGDNILSLTASHQPLGVVHGVPGTAPAMTEIQGALSSNWSTIKSLAINNFPCDVYLGNSFLIDVSATGAAGDYGGEHRTTTIDSSLILLSTGTFPQRFAKYLDRVEYIVVSRLYGSAATSFLLYSYYTFNGGSFGSESKTITPAVTYLLFRTNSNIINLNANSFTDNAQGDITFALYGSKIATNVNISVDYYALLPGSTVFLLQGSMANANFFYKGVKAAQASIASGITTGSKALSTTGNIIEFHPNKLNHFQSYLCPDGTVDPAITYTTTFGPIYLTPRWALL